MNEKIYDNSNHPSDAELKAYARGGGDRELLTHIAECSNCAERYGELIEAEFLFEPNIAAVRSLQNELAEREKRFARLRYDLRVVVSLSMALYMLLIVPQSESWQKLFNKSASVGQYVLEQSAKTYEQHVSSFYDSILQGKVLNINDKEKK